MKAEHARQITLTNLKGPVIEPILTYVFTKIGQAAKEGRSEITNPFTGIRTTVTPAMEEAVVARLRQDGYKVTNHPDPDPGYPGSGPYTTVSW